MDNKRIFSILVLCALGGVIAILLAACTVPFSGPNSEANSGSYSEAETPVQERQALVALYKATGGAEWRNNARWLIDQSVGTWQGVQYYRANRPVFSGDGGISETGTVEVVQGLSLKSNWLSGEIPPELGNLNYLTLLQFGGNQLSGEIPSELRSLKNLKTLDLSDNRLTGEIPAGLTSLRRLSYLEVSGNRLTGEIPRGLDTLYELYLQDNDLSLQIAPDFGGLGGPTELYLGGNRLSGCIPRGLHSARKNNFLRLGLDFCGERPLVRPGSPTAALVAFYNATGGESWSDDTNWMSTQELRNWYGVGARPMGGRVQGLSLKGNNLSGAIPSEVINLKDLMYLDLAENDLTGEIPSELGNLKDLRRLDLRDNKLTGEIPPQLRGASSLDSLYLGGNRLSGCRPFGGGLSAQENDFSTLGLPRCQLVSRNNREGIPGRNRPRIGRTWGHGWYGWRLGWALRTGNASGPRQGNQQWRWWNGVREYPI